MNILNIFLSIVFTICFFASTSAFSSEKCSKFSKLVEGGGCVAPMVRVLSSPSLFNGVDMVLTGVVHFEFERNQLYIDKYSSDNIIYENSLNLAIEVEDIKSLERFNGQVAKVYGKLNRLQDGYYYLVDIEKIDFNNGTLIFDRSSEAIKSLFINKN